MSQINWTSKPEAYCAEAKQRAAAALHLKHSKGLTALEKAYLAALKTGQVRTVRSDSREIK